MVTYEHKLQTITNDTAKAILGKKSYIVDITETCLASSKEIFELSVWTNSDNTKTIAISQCFWDEKTRIEKTIIIAIQKCPITKATNILYEIGTNKALHSTTYFSDWIVPSAKKLEEIIEHVF